jgi:hypothetical protein
MRYHIAVQVRRLLVVEIALVTGYLVAWAVRKARRVGKAVDDDVDEVLDASLDRLHRLISAKLGDDPAMERLQVEAAATGAVSERTRRRVDDAVAEAVEEDAGFMNALQAVLAELVRRSSGGAMIIGGDQAAAVGGSVSIGADHGSAAALTMGDVTIGVPSPDPLEPGRQSG